jgi:hypothetical protein
MNTIGNRPALTLLNVIAMGLAAVSLAAAGPPAPTSLAPANGASVTVPFTISWAPVSDPTGIVAYNWQVGSSASFAVIVLQNSTNGATQDTVSGLPDGTYFWRVDAVNGAFVTSAFSQAQSFTVTAAGPGEPGQPTLSPTKAYSTFHPFETITFNWTAVPGAATYVLQAAKDANFPIVTRIQFDNIPNTTFTFEIADPDQGNYFARVIAVNANGVASVPSNVITFSVFFNNPIGPPPVLSSPATGTALTLPVTLAWLDVPNPQPSGYELQIARDSGFAAIEEDDPQQTEPSRTILSLTPGTKFWRVRSAQGDNSATTAAETAFSAVRSFTIPATPPTPVSVTVVNNPMYSGSTTFVAIQLTAAVGASGATIAFSSSNSTAVPVPATVAMPANTAWTQFQITAGQVTAPTPVILTATLNSASATLQFTLQPPSLNSLIISPSTISGGGRPQAIVALNGQAPAGGAAVSLVSNSAAVQPPAVANVAPGSSSVSLAIPTNSVTVNTTATVTATWNGVSSQAHVTLTPQPPPASITLSPASTVGGSPSGSFATVTVASPSGTDSLLQVTVSNPSVATEVPTGVLIPAGSTTGGFSISTAPVGVQTVVTISVTGGGVTKSAALTVTPTAAPPPVTLSAIGLSPSTVAGGNSSLGTATLASPAGSGGAVVTLTSSNTSAATVPASVTVAAGATSATFTVSAAPVTAAASATISGVSGGVTRSAVLTVTPPAQTATLTVTATGKSGNTVSSSPAGISVAVGSSKSAPFTTGTAITLSVSNGRDAIWSGGCSSGGNKTKTCTFTLTGNATVAANVQ